MPLGGVVPGSQRVTDDPETKSMPPNDGSSMPSPEPASFQLKPGDRVGNYVIREQIGEGGFAIVYAAEQEKPVRRKVALKIIKLGMDTKQVIARFEAERQALAMMDHPNVAKVFDAGVTDRGRPYFVMEYVPGEPITDYCKRHRLSTSQRLNLFTHACQAVQHAHQRGIIHRDIKPSNVLVAAKEGEPVVKVIDFGVAKAISQRLTESTVYTEQGQLIGTPEYMSPEQAEMGALDVDTRTDVYSLGMVLYELLVGALPFDPIDLRRAALAEMQRIIREQEPPKPSTRLSSLGNESGIVPSKPDAGRATLLSDLRGDLDWITMKALEKDRTRRYPGASELAADVRRHLDGDPVSARKPSFGYVFGKLMAKERGKVALVLAILASLFFGAAVLAWRAEQVGHGQFISARALAYVERELANRTGSGLGVFYGPRAFDEFDTEIRETWEGIDHKAAARLGTVSGQDSRPDAERIDLSSWDVRDLRTRRQELWQDSHSLPSHDAPMTLLVLGLLILMCIAAVWRWKLGPIVTGSTFLVIAVLSRIVGVRLDVQLWLYSLFFVFWCLSGVLYHVVRQDWDELKQHRADAATKIWGALMFPTYVGAVVLTNAISDPLGSVLAHGVLQVSMTVGALILLGILLRLWVRSGRLSADTAAN